MNLNKSPVKVTICQDEEASWDTSWKWFWFTREQWISESLKENRISMKPLFSLLSRLQVKSILDCSCGLGFKTVLIAKKGYEVEGSDGSAVAVKYAPELAKGEKLSLRFFHSRWEELDKKCKRKYDCVISDYFDEIKTRKILKASAKGICSVLNENGKFIFGTLSKDADLNELIEKEWKKRKRFDILPPCEKEGKRVTSVEVADLTSDGILENRIFLIEEQGEMRSEIAFVMNPRIKWTFKDYEEVLKEAGFSKVECFEQDEQIYNIGIK
jgi:SAM-dependent methyltransferase